MSTDTVPQLDPAEWDDYSLRLLARTYRVLRLFFGYTDKVALPCGETPESVVEKLVRAYVTGKRKINPKYPVYGQLCRAMKSRLWGLHQRKENKLTDSDEDEATENVADAALTPAESAEDQDACNAIFGALLAHPKVIKSADLTKLVRAFALGKSDENELSAEIGLPITRIYQLRRELREIRPAISAKLKKEGVLLA